MSRPRLLLIGVILPKTLWAAVMPIAITRSGLIAASSRSYHGRHALISGVLGFWCRRIFPRGTNLKCFTALPVLLRHFLFHRFHFQPRRIENAGVIAPPGLLQPVLGRRFRLGDALSERQCVAVPMGAEIGREDRPGHIGEAAREKRRGELDDVVFRLEPGDVMRFRVAADL